MAGEDSSMLDQDEALDDDYEYDDYDDDWDDDFYDGEDPCLTCGSSEWCDGWEAAYCCTRCHYLGGGDCSTCDSWDI